MNTILKSKKFDIIIHCATHYKKKHDKNDINKMVESNIYLGNVILENIKLKSKKIY